MPPSSSVRCTINALPPIPSGPHIGLITRKGHTNSESPSRRSTVSCNAIPSGSLSSPLLQPGSSVASRRPFIAPRWDETKVKHAWHTIPENWVGLGHPSAGITIDLHLALKSHDENALIDALDEVSDPNHPSYRAYLSKEQVADLVGQAH
ncbi:hypothetical protein EDB85DRAFT_2151850 [Lactarius pseudohatsudake]|nr:hypothetical protein EDB85DRAFT_2151850 [Lactarius pseudohatsudake]